MKGRKRMSDKEFSEKAEKFVNVVKMAESLDGTRKYLAQLGLSYVTDLDGELRRRCINNPLKKYRHEGLASTANQYHDIDDEVLTTKEACAYLKISRPTYMNNYVYTGKISATKIGKGWKVYRSELNRLMKSEIS